MAGWWWSCRTGAVCGRVRMQHHLAMAKWCCIRTRPQTAPVRHDHHHPAIAGQHTPHFLQHIPELLAAFHRMNHQHPINRDIRQRQLRLVGKRHQPRALARPLHHTLLCRHDLKYPRGFIAKRPNHGRGITEPHQIETMQIRPDLAHPTPDHALRQLPEAGAVKLPKIDRVVEHGSSELLCSEVADYIWIRLNAETGTAGRTEGPINRIVGARIKLGFGEQINPLDHSGLRHRLGQM